MKANVITKSAERCENNKKEQKVVRNLAANEAIVSKVRTADGNYLCLTDNKGVKLRVRLNQNCVIFADSNRGMRLVKSTLSSCPLPQGRDCECVYRLFGTIRLCYNPLNGNFCNC